MEADHHTFVLTRNPEGDIGPLIKGLSHDGLVLPWNLRSVLVSTGIAMGPVHVQAEAAGAEPQLDQREWMDVTEFLDAGQGHEGSPHRLWL